MIMKLKVHKPHTRVHSFQPQKIFKVEDKNQNKQGMNSSAEKETGEEKDIFRPF